MRENSRNRSPQFVQSSQHESPEVVAFQPRRQSPVRPSTPPLIDINSPVRMQSPLGSSQQNGNQSQTSLINSNTVPTVMIDAQVAFRLIDSFKDIAKQLAPKEDRPVNDKQRIDKFNGDKDNALEWLEE